MPRKRVPLLCLSFLNLKNYYELCSYSITQGCSHEVKLGGEQICRGSGKKCENSFPTKLKYIYKKTTWDEVSSPFLIYNE